MATSAYVLIQTEVGKAARVAEAVGAIDGVVAADNVIDYAARLVRSTRPAGGEGETVPDFIAQWVRWGAGPRAGQSLLLAGKARAVLNGRPAVSLEDVRAVAPPVLRHRILVNFQAEADGVDAEHVVSRLLDSVPAR